MPGSWQQESAVVLLSGGQDSTTCLYWAKREFGHVEALSFDYGQRHRAELDAASRIAHLADVNHRMLTVASLRELGGGGLTSDTTPIDEYLENGLPTSFVPGRNVLFLTLAAAFAYQREIHHLVTGVCQTDYSGYPDCRAETIAAVQLAVSLGMDTRFYIHTPLMWLTKAESVHLARDVGAMDALAYSHTCYNGDFPPCGKCPACELRAKGFEIAGFPDPLIERASATATA